MSTWWTPISRRRTASETQLRVGRLTKAHGLKGAIKLEVYTDDPGRRFVPGAVFSLQVPESSEWFGKTLTLTELRWYNEHPVGFFEGIGDRSAAEGLIKAILLIDTDPTEVPGEGDAWYDHQLVGLTVIRDGAEVGKVSRVDHLPAQDLLVVDTGDAEVLLPFVKAIVPTVDIEAGTVTVTPPLGLFEDVPEDPLDASAGASDADEDLDLADASELSDAEAAAAADAGADEARGR